MLKIRFLRTGKKNRPFFRIVVTDERNAPQSGRFLEIVGFWDPLTKERKIEKEKVKYWLSKGAQLSESVHNLFVSEKIIEGQKIAVHHKSKSKSDSSEEVKDSNSAGQEVENQEEKQEDKEQKEGEDNNGGAEEKAGGE